MRGWVVSSMLNFFSIRKLNLTLTLSEKLYTCFQGIIYNPRIVFNICPNSLFVICWYQMCYSSWFRPVAPSLLTTMDHICQVCDKPFPSSSKLMTHSRTHSGEKPFGCTICQKLFSCSSSLKSHHRTHTGEQLFPCTICDKSFSVSSSLKMHQRMHSGKMLYSCSKCPKSFSQSGNLRTHMIIHNG